MNSRTEQYGYDELSRLTTVNYGDGGTQSYSFDNMGNRLQKVDSGTGTQTNTFDAANRLTSVNGAAYTNDADGNTLTGGGRTNTWDSENRLITCANGTNASIFTYGSDGLRHRSSVNGTTTDFALDGDSVVREMRAGVNYATYLSGPTGPMYRRSDGDGTIRWYVYDGLGSVVGEVDPNGVMTARRGFDVYGATRSSSGTATSKHGFVGSLGHTTEDESGLIYMRARYYDPNVGRFVSEDPSKNGANWFAYADDNPINMVDPTGRAGLTPGNFWDIFNLVYGYYQLGQNLLALARFVQSVYHAKGPDAVEDAWGNFMNSWSPSGGLNNTGYGAAQMIIDAIRANDAGSLANLVTSAVQIGAQLAVLCIAYDFRIEYYCQMDS